jgi:hypothetical protein
MLHKNITTIIWSLRDLRSMSEKIQKISKFLKLRQDPQFRSIHIKERYLIKMMIRNKQKRFCQNISLSITKLPNNLGIFSVGGWRGEGEGGPFDMGQDLTHWFQFQRTVPDFYQKIWIPNVYRGLRCHDNFRDNPDTGTHTAKTSTFRCDNNFPCDKCTHYNP